MTLNKLSIMYENAPKGEIVTMVHLFGIRYSEQIQKSGFSKKEIARAAKIAVSCE